MLTKSVLFSTRMWTCTLHRSTLIFFSSIKIVWILQWSGIVFYSQFSNWGLVLIKILDSVSVSVLFSVFYHPNCKNMIVLHGGGIDHHVDHSSNQFISWQQHWAMWEWREKVRSCQSHLFSGPAMYERRHRVLFCLLLNILTALSQDQAFPSPCGEVVMSSLIYWGGIFETFPNDVTAIYLFICISINGPFSQLSDWEHLEIVYWKLFTVIET